MLYKAFVRNKVTGETQFIESDYERKLDFINDLRCNGYSVICVELKELYDFMLNETNLSKFEWKLAKKIYKECKVLTLDEFNRRFVLYVS